MRGKIVAILIAVPVSLAGWGLLSVVRRPPIPEPALTECDQPLPGGVPDLRGHWRLTHSENVRSFLIDGAGVSSWRAMLAELRLHINYVERIEQCDLRGAVTDNRDRSWTVQVFSLEESASSPAAAVIEDGKLVLQADGRGRHFVVERELVDDELQVTTHAPGDDSPMRLFLRR